MLDHAAIARLIPHQGRMCLLHTVSAWDQERICAQAISHTSEQNPLRNAQGLPATAGIEYAAQAMAVHGALRAGSSGVPEQGRLVTVRQVMCTTPWLHDLAHGLDIVAEHLMSDSRTMMYQFTVASAGVTLVSGRATVSLQPDPMP